MSDNMVSDSPASSNIANSLFSKLRHEGNDQIHRIWYGWIALASTNMMLKSELNYLIWLRRYQGKKLALTWLYLICTSRRWRMVMCNELVRADKLIEQYPDWHKMATNDNKYMIIQISSAMTYKSTVNCWGMEEN